MHCVMHCQFLSASCKLQRLFIANRNWNIRADVRANGRAKKAGTSKG